MAPAQGAPTCSESGLDEVLLVNSYAPGFGQRPSRPARRREPSHPVRRGKLKVLEDLLDKTSRRRRMAAGRRALIAQGALVTVNHASRIGLGSWPPSDFLSIHGGTRWETGPWTSR